MQKVGKWGITSGLFASIVAAVYLAARNRGQHAGVSKPTKLVNAVSPDLVEEVRASFTLRAGTT